jgi:hypothetical protein
LEKTVDTVLQRIDGRTNDVLATDLRSSSSTAAVAQDSSAQPAPLFLIQDATTQAGMSGSHIVSESEGESRDVIDSGLVTLVTAEILLKL